MDDIEYDIFESPMMLSARSGAIKSRWKKTTKNVVKKSDDSKKAEELLDKALISSINMLPLEQQAALMADEDAFDKMLKDIAEAIDLSGILKSILKIALNIIATTLINIILGKIFPATLDKQ